VGVMLFATYAGPGPGAASGIAVDSTGVYVTGSWREPEGSAFTGYAGGDSDVYILKLSPTGVPLYRTMIGGSQSDEGNSIAVDSRQSAWVAGVTRSADLHHGVNGRARAFVAKFDAAGRRIVFATYGGEGHATAKGIAV